MLFFQISAISFQLTGNDGGRKHIVMNISFGELFKLGGPIMWLLFATSITALAFILDRIYVFTKYRQDFDLVVQTLRPLIISGDWQEAEEWCRRRGPYTRIAAVYLRQRNQPKEVREDLVRREGLIIISHLDKGLRWLAMLAQVSTLLGLLATFHVMIVRFSQGQGQANFISGVWEALLTTMYGLMIAIPCSAVYQVLEGRVDAIARHMDILVSYMDDWRRNMRTPDVSQRVNEGQGFGTYSIERS